MRRGRFFRFLVDGKNLNGICLRPIAVGHNMSIVSFRCKGFTGKHGHTLGIVSIPATVPGFDNPVIKYITFRRSRRSAGADIGVLNIDSAVCGRVGAPDMISTQIIAVCRIDDIDAVCVFKHLTPLGIKVKPLGDPGTVIRGVGVGSAACFHIPRAVPGRRALLRLRVGRRGGLIIVGGNGGFIQPRAFCPGRTAGGVPAQELVAVTFAGRGADRSAVSHTEGQRLVIGAPIEVGIIDLRQAGMQEHTVLDLPPLGVDLNTADRHFAPGVWRSAAFIEVPALKDISAFRASRNIVLILIRNRGTLSNRTTLVKKMLCTILDLVSITVDIVAVKVTDLILLTIVYIVQMIERRVVACCPVVAVIPVLPSLFNKCKSFIFRLVLAANLRVTGTNLHYSIFIVCLSVICSRGLPCIILTLNGLKPNVVSPVIITAWETHDHIVPVWIIGSAKDILIQNRDDALNRTGA